MSTTLWALIFPIVFFSISSIMFQGSQNTAPLEETQDTIFCDFPDFYLGGNSTGNGCIGNHNDPYSDDVYVIWEVGFNFFSENSTNLWNATIPTGGFNYSTDWTFTGITKLGALIVYLPLLILTLTFPIDLEVELGTVGGISTAYGIIWGVEFYGLWKTISPFVGR